MAVSICMACALSACFTGIESTPKIGAADIRKQNAYDMPEQSYLNGIGPQPFARWAEGKQFLVTDGKLALLLGAEAENGYDLAGTILTYNGAVGVTSLTGESVTDLRFTTENGNHVAYRLDASPEKIRERGTVEIPLTIELSVVEAVKHKMLGQTYYIVTRDWYDTANKLKHGRKYVPVKVVDVMPGSSFYPILLVMEDGKGVKFHLYMSVGSDIKAPRSFASLFSLTNPRLRYPTITDAVWQHIVDGTVAEEMTRDECRLALGAPDNIDRRVGYSVLHEVWSYENGKYLIFEDGLLKSFRQ